MSTATTVMHQWPGISSQPPENGALVSRVTVGGAYANGGSRTNYAQNGSSPNADGLRSDESVLRSSGAQPLNWGRDHTVETSLWAPPVVQQQQQQQHPRNFYYDSFGYPVPSHRNVNSTRTSFDQLDLGGNDDGVTGTETRLEGGSFFYGTYPAGSGYGTTMPDVNTGGHSASVIHTHVGSRPPAPPPLPSLNGNPPTESTDLKVNGQVIPQQNGKTELPVYTTDFGQAGVPLDLTPAEKGTYKLLLSLDGPDGEVPPPEKPALVQPEIIQTYEVKNVQEKHGPASIFVSTQNIFGSADVPNDASITGPLMTSRGAEVFNPAPMPSSDKSKHAKVTHIQPNGGKHTENSDWHIIPQKADIYYEGGSEYQVVAEKVDIYHPGSRHTPSVISSGSHSASVIVGGREDVIRLPNNKPANVSTQHFGSISRRPVPAPAPVIVPPVVGCPDLSVQAPAQWRKDAPSTVRAYTGEVGEGEVTAETVSPAGLTSPVSVFKVSEDMGEHHITFTPTEKGQWKVRIFYEKSEVQHSPFYVNVYDPSQAIIIGNTPTAVPHQPYSFEVDCLQAGYSEIDVNVSHNGASVNTQLSNAGVDRTRVTFTPASAGTYRVTAFNGGVQIPGSPFEVSMSTFDVRASGDGLYNGIQGKTLSFTVDVSDNPGKKLGVTITAPSMDYVVPRIEDRGREFFVTYVPEEIGTHTVEVAYHDRQHVAGSPYSVHIREPRIYVHNMQPVAYRNQRHSFEVDASEHSSGTIEIDSDLPVLNYEKKAERVYGITYLPRRLGEHDIVLKFKDKLIEGCPFNITVYESQ